MSIIKVDTDEIQLMSKEGGELVFKPEAEIALYQLFRLRALIDQAIENAGEMIRDQGLAISPHFTSVQSDHVKASYREASTAKFSMTDDANVGALQRLGVLEKKVSYSLNSKEILKYKKAKGKLPNGVTANEREKKVYIRVINTGDVPEQLEVAK